MADLLYENSLPTLPEDLIGLNVLSRIQDVKFIGRCMCVSKTWQSLLSSHEFAKSHLKMHNNGPENILFLVEEGKPDGDSALLDESADDNSAPDEPAVDDSAPDGPADDDSASDEPDDNAASDDDSALLDEPDDDSALSSDEPKQLPEDSPYVATLGDHSVARKLELPFLEGKKFRWPAQVQGSCNGLVLFFFHQGLLLVNPTTRKALEIPPYGGGINHGFGLGHDSSADDYKVVSVQGNNIDVYSAKTQIWRTFKNSSSFCYHIVCSTRPFVNGHINFVSLTTEATVLAAFNVATEELERVPYPRGVDTFRAFDDRFSVFGGCLSLVVSLGRFSYDVWVMKEYGIQDSWTKFTINPDIYCYRPLCFLSKDENEIVSLEADFKGLKLIGNFFAHDRRSGVSRDLAVDGMPGKSICVGTGISFRESLISPNYGGSVLPYVFEFQFLSF